MIKDEHLYLRYKLIICWFLLKGFKEFMEAVDEERLEHWLKLSLEEATDKKG